MKKFMELSMLINFTFLSIVSAYSQNQSNGGIYGRHWACYLSPPDGWVLDSETLSRYDIHALFYEEGKTYGGNTPIIYVDTVDLIRDTDAEMEKIIAMNLENYKNSGLRFDRINKKINSIKDTYYIYDIEDSVKNFETVVYRRYKNICFVITLSSTDKETREQLFPKLESIVKNMRIIDR